MRILLVEDDPNISRSIEMLLHQAKIKVYTTGLGEDAIDLAKFYEHDLIVLDLNLPDMGGHDVLRLIRLANIQTPVLILSGADDTQSKVLGFRRGADDYLTKPFDGVELLARIHAIVRRSKGYAQSVIKTGPIEVNIDAKTVTVHGAPVKTTTKEYQFLELLSLRKGTTLGKETLLDHLYGEMDEPEPKSIDVFVFKLRRKIRAVAGGQHLIDTVRGRGYVLREPKNAVATT